MSKQNKFIFRIIGILVLALLICLCFLGSTFARYTSTASGTGGVGIAKWDVGGTFAYTYSSDHTITPNKNEYTDTSYNAGEARSKTSNLTQCMVVSNDGDVDALLETDITKSNVKFYYYTDDNSSTSAEVTFPGDNGGYGTGRDGSSVSYTGSYTYLTATTAQSMFSYNLYIKTSSIDGYNLNSSEYIEISSAEYYVLWSAAPEALRVVARSTSLDIYAQFTWTSDIDGNVFGETADAIDTWIGENVDFVTFDVTCTAVQYSENPS